MIRQQQEEKEEEKKMEQQKNQLNDFSNSSSKRGRSGQQQKYHHSHLPLSTTRPQLLFLVLLSVTMLSSKVPQPPPPAAAAPNNSSNGNKAGVLTFTPVDALSSSPSTPPPPHKTKTKNVLVVGGSGRVGGSTVSWLETFSERSKRKTRKDDGANAEQAEDEDPLSDMDYPELKDLNIMVGGRSSASFRNAVLNQKLFSSRVGFVQLDLERDSDDDLEAKLLGGVQGSGSSGGGSGRIDLVVHTAGPFQGRRDPNLLRVCVRNKIPYVDVCDEYELALTAKEELFEAACRNQVPAVVCGGIWPGISSLMAMDAVDQLLLSLWSEMDTEEEKDDKTGDVVDTSVDVDVDYSFFTAGTGNAGPTIVSATFLLLATPVLTYKNSKPTPVEPWTARRTVDFGNQVGGSDGKKPVWLLDNPDVPTTASALLSRSSQSTTSNCNSNCNINNVNVSSRFGTDPLVWNYLFGAIKTVIPTEFLKNQPLMQNFALFSEPIIRLVDKFVGATNAMRVDVTLTTTSTSTATATNNNNKTTASATTESKANLSAGKQQHIEKKQKKKTSLIVHPDLERCVGLATAAFAVEVLRSSSTDADTDTDVDYSNDAIIPPGVWYPAELPDGVRRNLLEAAKEEAITYDI